MDAGHTPQRQTPVALIQRLGRDGEVLQSTPVFAWPVRIGRSLACDLVLDDPHLAPDHAELLVQDGALVLRLGQTINGALVGERQVKAGDSAAIEPGQTWHIGLTRLRVRMASEPMAAELPLARHQHLVVRPAEALRRASWQTVLPWMTLWLLALVFDEWLSGNPGMQASAYLSAILGAFTGIMTWALLWSLGNKLFEGHLNFLAHLHRALRYGLGMMLLTAALPVLAFTLDLPFLSRISEVAGMAAICALVASHLALISPAHKRALSVGVATVFLLGWSLYAWFNVQRGGRVFSEQYVSALTPPSWRQASTAPLQALLTDAKGMKAALDKQARDDEKDGADDLVAED